MDQLADLISRQLAGAFERAGYSDADARATLSNRPDLCEYQCNGALPAAKLYHKAPIQIAQAVAAELSGCELFESVEAVNPGFLNMKLSGAFLAQYLTEMAQSDRLGVPQEETPRTIVLDYGGPNVAKPLHIGHLRSAIIGESVKRIDRWFGNRVIGDIHLGDWGLQMGLIIAQLQDDQPELPRPRRLPSRSWKRSIPPPAPAARRTKPLPPARTTRRISFRAASAATARSGGIS